MGSIWIQLLSLNGLTHSSMSWTDEGAVVGLDLLNFETGRAMYPKNLTPGISTNNVVIGSNLVGGEPGLVTKVLTDNQVSASP